MLLLRCLIIPARTFPVVIERRRWFSAFALLACVRLAVGGVFFLTTQHPIPPGTLFQIVVPLAFALYPTLGWFFLTAAFAGIVMLFLIVGEKPKQQLRYTSLLVAVVYANCVSLVRDAIELGMSMFFYLHSGSLFFTRWKLPALDLLLDPYRPSRFVVTMAESVDPIALWFLLLASIGVAHAAGIPGRRAGAYVAATWILGTLWGAGLRVYFLGGRI